MMRGTGVAARLRLGLAVAGVLALLACGKTPAPAPAAAGKGTPAVAKAPGATGKPAADKPAGPKAPKLEVEKTTVDVGEITRGEKAVHVFTLKNTGTDVLHIGKAKGS